MKAIICSSLIILTVSLFSCNQSPKADKKSDNYDSDTLRTSFNHEWNKLRCGLYTNSKGDLAFATDPEIAFTPQNELEAERCPNVFITEFGTYDDTTKLKAVIDTTTFKPLGANMFKDKNHIYSYYAMCDGGYFDIFSDDTTGFALLSGTYFQFKSKIYHTRHGLMDADAASFTVFEDFGHIAKDKNGYFSFHEKISEKDLMHELGAELYNKLKSIE